MAMLHFWSLGISCSQPTDDCAEQKAAVCNSSNKASNKKVYPFFFPFTMTLTSRNSETPTFLIAAELHTSEDGGGGDEDVIFLPEIGLRELTCWRVSRRLP
jgi:hypothetical protein